ncbi:uncharacterized protein LOC124168332 [Ischnura elegans]|uniref:uncharacterized protein LOC124168332 n=1 Tax=Ischnura elegans TaxID=197161 RepID=UPI001ED8AA10|nr:uncharacterized protein LOC124168332 [Ischnura elegans]
MDPGGLHAELIRRTPLKKRSRQISERNGEYDGELSYLGYSYKLKLLMVLALRGLKNNSFNLEAGMKVSGNCDHLILESVRGLSGGKSFHFLYPKRDTSGHKNGISIQNMLQGDDGDFNLKKYFKLFLKIREDPRYRGEEDEIKDLILYTNTNFKYGDRLGDFELCDDIFIDGSAMGGEGKLDEIPQTKILHFKTEFSGKDFVESHLKDIFIDLPKVFAEKVLHGKDFNLDEYHTPPRLRPILQLYEKALFNEVIESESGMFQEDFVEMNNLSPEASHFRSTLQREFFRSGQGNDTVFKDTIRNKHLEIHNHETGLDIKTATTEYLAEQFALLIGRNVDSKIIKTSEVDSPIMKNIFNLSSSIFIKVEGKVKINPRFLEEEDFLVNNSFRDHLIHKLNQHGIDLIDLEDFVFEKMNLPNEGDKKITGHYIEETINSFFEKLAFAVNQPDEETLDDIIRSELLEDFHENETQNAYIKLLVETFYWVEDKGGKFFSPDDIHFQFEMIKKKAQASMWFEVKTPAYNFVGRARELSTISKALHGNKKVQSAAVITNSASISHLGGVGKTELAKQFVFHHSSEYENIIWINAESLAAMANSFHRLAFVELGISEVNSQGKTKRLESVVDEVYSILWGKKSIFIFDNADKMKVEKDADAEIQVYMPKCSLESKHSMLITSQSSNWGDLKPITLIALAERESLEFVEKSINLSKTSEKAQAKNLVKALRYYPLALRLAVSYIVNANEEKMMLGKNFTIADYMELFQDARANLYDYAINIEDTDSYSKIIGTTWKIIVDDIVRKTDHKLAEELLYMISYCAPHDVSLENLQAMLGVTDETAVLRALRQLQQYSAVEIIGSKVSAHRLVQLLTRLRLKRENKEEEILRRMLETAPKLDEENIISIWKFSSSNKNLTKAFGYLVSNVINRLFDNFNLKEVLSFGRKSILAMGKHLGTDHSFVLEAKQSLAQILDQIGDYEGALMQYEELYQKYEKTLGKSNHKTIQMKHSIANMMYNLGNYYEALDYYKSMHNQVIGTHGEDSPDALNLKQNIANVLCNLGEVTQSLKLYHEVHEKLKFSVGEFDINTLNAKKNIASVLEKLGDYYEALNNYEEVYHHLKTILDKDDPLTLKTKHSIASLLDQIGRHEEALRAFKDVNKIYEMKYGEQHPESMNTKFSIANILFKLERNQEALESYESVYLLIKHAYGEKHEKAIHAKFCIAQVLGSLEKHEKAIGCYREVYEHFRKSLGERHPKVLHMKQSIANTMYNLGSLDKALELYQEIYGQIKMDLGEDNPQAISIRQLMADIYEKLGNYEEAFSIYRTLNKKMRVIYGEWNEETLTTEHNMASVLLKLGKANESLSCYENVYQKQRAILGESHPTTKATKEDMTIAWHKMRESLQNSGDHRNSKQSLSIELQCSIDGDYFNDEERNETGNEKYNATHAARYHRNYYSSYLCGGCFKGLAYNCTLL